MKIPVYLTAVIVSLGCQAAYPQAPQPSAKGAQAATSPQSMAAQAGIFVFGKNSQTPEQQQQDEFACFQFAQQQTGANPFTFHQETQQKVADAKSQARAEGRAAPPPEKVKAKKVRGARLAGAARGAVGGAVIGKIAGDTGKGAKIGATAGSMRAGRNQRQANRMAKKKAEAANAQAQQQHRQAQDQAVEQAGDKVLAEAEVTKKNFKNAFAACMEAKDYAVKW